MIYDLVVIGGGPAGISSAIAFKNKNPDSAVAVIEPEAFDVGHKIGEALLTSTVMDMHKLGIIEDVQKEAVEKGWVFKKGASYIFGDDRIPWIVNANRFMAEDEMDYPSCMIEPETGIRQTLMLKRHEFDSFLHELAEKRGISFLKTRVKDIAFVGNDGIAPLSKKFIKKITTVDEQGGVKSVRSQFYIDASGHAALIGKSLGIREPFFKEDFEDKTKTARYVYLKKFDFSKMRKSGMDRHLTNIISSPFGWMWIIPTGGKDDLTSIGIVGTKDTWKLSGNDFFTALKNTPEFKAFGLDSAEFCDYLGNPLTKPYVKSDYSFVTQSMSGGNWVLTGDAAAFIDPILSQGVSLAFHFGRKAGECIDLCVKSADSDLSVYGDSYTRAYLNELRVLYKVVSMWYGEDKNSEAWRDLSQHISKSVYGRSHIENNLKGFQWVTSLENLHVYHEFDDELDAIPQFEKILIESANNI